MLKRFNKETMKYVLQHNLMMVIYRLFDLMVCRNQFFHPTKSLSEFDRVISISLVLILAINYDGSAPPFAEAVRFARVAQSPAHLFRISTVLFLSSSTFCSLPFTEMVYGEE